MADYSLTIARGAAKDLEALPSTVARRIDAKILSLAREPRLHGVKKLRGERALWRIRIGDYRVIYSIDDGAKIVDITAIRHRSKAYE